MGLDALASLIVASFDLSIVRLLRDAIRTADLSQNHGRLNKAAEAEPHRRVNPSPVPKPCECEQPSSKAERPAAIVEIRPDLANTPPCCDAVYSCEEAPRPLRGHSPIEPPWKVLPWMRLPEPRPKLKIVKIITRPPDSWRTGALVDRFM